jgi:hypothetical protein
MRYWGGWPMQKFIISFGAGAFWLLLLVCPLMILISVGQGAPTNLLDAIARAIAAAPAFALYLIGVPEAPAKAAGALIAIASFSCVVIQFVGFVRRRFRLRGDT